MIRCDFRRAVYVRRNLMERSARVRQYILRLLLLQGGQGGAVLRVKRFVVQKLLRRRCVCRIRLKRRVIRQKRQFRIIWLIVQQVGQQRRGIIRVCRAAIDCQHRVRHRNEQRAAFTERQQQRHFVRFARRKRRVQVQLRGLTAGHGENRDDAARVVQVAQRRRPFRQIAGFVVHQRRAERDVLPERRNEIRIGERRLDAGCFTARELRPEKLLEEGIRHAARIVG